MNRPARRLRGVTLIEVLVTLLIGGIVIALLLPLQRDVALEERSVRRELRHVDRRQQVLQRLSRDLEEGELDGVVVEGRDIRLTIQREGPGETVVYVLGEGFVRREVEGANEGRRRREDWRSSCRFILLPDDSCGRRVALQLVSPDGATEVHILACRPAS